MNCVELQASLVETEDSSSVGRNPEQRAHLKACPECSTLVAELNLIAATAIELRGANEPSPRVWNSIEIALRQEGLIRPQRAGGSLLPSFGAAWGAVRWLAPAAAMLLLALGIYVRRESLPRPVAEQAAVVAPAVANPSDLNDEDLMQEV